MEKDLQIEEIARKYNNREIWPSSDKWHTYTHHVIEDYIKNFLINYSNKDPLILNAGSGGNNYGLINERMIHVDIAKEKIKEYPGYILSSVEDIPLEDNSVDLCICVGSVINYCNPERAISEFGRVLKPGSVLIIEFEKTNSFDLIFTQDFSKGRTISETFYNGEKEKIWLYHEQTVINILENRFTILNYNRFHLISPLIYRFTKNENFSSNFSSLDKVLKYIPIINKFSSNIILTCLKPA